MDVKVPEKHNSIHEKFYKAIIFYGGQAVYRG